MKTKITDLFGIQHPIVSGGMVWCSGHRLASAVSLAGGLGLIGAGSMHPETLAQHIAKCKVELNGTGKVFGVNVPIFYPQIDQVIDMVIAERVPIVFTSGGSPALYTQRLKEAGIIVVHVVASAKFALKAQVAGVDAVVCEGFEAGGHNGREETTTMVLTPAVCAAVDIPVIAAGGIATGSQMLAAMALGADGVQIGTRFALCVESSAHDNFKELCRSLTEGDTMLALKKITPVRLVKNSFYDSVAHAEARGASVDELREILGSRRSKLGIFEGDTLHGELEIGQAATLVERTPQTAAQIIDNICSDYQASIERLIVGTRDVERGTIF